MEKISLRQYVIAGIKSGVIMSFLVFIPSLLLSLLFPNFGLRPSDLILCIYYYPINNILIGIIIGIVLFLTYDKIFLIKNTSLKYLTILGISFFVIEAIIFSSFLFSSMGFYLLAIFQFGILWELMPVPFLAEFFVAIGFRFLMIYFITRIERKMERKELQPREILQSDDGNRDNI